MKTIFNTILNNKIFNVRDNRPIILKSTLYVIMKIYIYILLKNGDIQHSQNLVIVYTLIDDFFKLNSKITIFYWL